MFVNRLWWGRFALRPWLTALDHARIDQALKCILHDLDRIRECLDRKNKSLPKYFLRNVIRIALGWRQTNQINTHDRAADSDFVDSVRKKFIVHCLDS